MTGNICSNLLILMHLASLFKVLSHHSTMKDYKLCNELDQYHSSAHFLRYMQKIISTLMPKS